MALVEKNNIKQIFADQAPAEDRPATFANYPRGWDTSRQNNGKPTIKQFNYLQQRTDQNFLWMHQNGAALPYDATMEYAEGAVVVKDGKLQQKQGDSWVNVVVSTASELMDASGKNQQEINDSIGAKWRSKPNGYALNDRVMLENGDIVRSMIAGNINNPNIDMTGWEYVNKFSHQKPLINQKNVNQFCKVWSLERTTATGGIFSVPQGVAYDPINQRLFQVAEGGADGRGHSLNIYEAKTTGTLSGDMYVSNRSRFFGHQGVDVSYHGDDTVAWMSSNYRGDNAPIADSGNKVTAFANFRDTATNDITDVYVFKLFDNGDIDQSCTPTVSSCGRYLVAKYASSYHPMCAIRVFDVQKMWSYRDTNLDYSNDYLYQFDYEWLSGTDLQGLACDGNFVYIQMAQTGFNDNAWITIFTLNGEFVDKVNFSVVGHQDALDDKPVDKAGRKEYEGLFILQDTLFTVMTTAPNPSDGSQASCYVYAIGVNNFTLKDKDSNIVTVNYMHSASPRNTDYCFGVKNKSNDLYWRVSSNDSQKGALLNRDNPHLTIGGIGSGLQLASNSSEGMSNLLLARTDDSNTPARLIFYKSRSGDLKETRKSIGSSQLAVIPFYGDTGTADVMAANITVNGDVDGVTGYIDGRITIATRDNNNTANNFTFNKDGITTNRNNTHDIGTSVNAFKKAWFRGLSVKDLPVFSDNAAAVAGDLVVGDVYRTPLSDVKVVSTTVLKWLAMGDSITDTTTSHPSYAAKVAGILTAQLIDCAISGTRIRSAFARTTASNANITAANVISIFYGTNDYSRNTPLGTIADTPTSRATLDTEAYRQDSNVTGSFYADYKGVIESIYTTNPQAKIVLITPLFRYREVDGAANSAGITLKQYVDAVKSVADYYNLSIIDLYSDSGVNRVTGATWLSDGLHPTQWTQDNVIAPLISSKLKTML